MLSHGANRFLEYGQAGACEANPGELRVAPAKVKCAEGHGLPGYAAPACPG